MSRYFRSRLVIKYVGNYMDNKYVVYMIFWVLGSNPICDFVLSVCYFYKLVSSLLMLIYLLKAELIL